MTGDELRKLRARLGWTQERMAQELGFAHRNSIWLFESGARRITKKVELAVRYLALQADRDRKG